MYTYKVAKATCASEDNLRYFRRKEWRTYHDSGQNQDLVSCSPLKMPLYVDSESVIRYMIALRNRKIPLKTGFDFYLPEAVFYSVGGGDMNKLTSEMESTHII